MRGSPPEQMTTSLGSIVSSILTVTLIGAATRWLAAAKGSELPETRDGNNLYRIKWQWRAVAFAGGFFGITLCTLASRDFHSRPSGELIGITVAFVAACVWIATGSVTTDQNWDHEEGALAAFLFAVERDHRDTLAPEARWSY